MSKLTAKSVLAEVLMIKEDTKDLLEKVSEWNECKDVSKCDENLNELLKAKMELDDPQTWPQLYLSNGPIQQYLKWISDVIPNESFENIKYLVQNLVEPSEINTVGYFPGKHSIFKWLYQVPIGTPVKCDDITMFQDFIQKALKQLDEAAAREMEQTEIQVTSYLAEAINCLCADLKLHTYDYLFVVTLLYPLGYDTDENFFDRLLTRDDLEYLSKELDHQITTFQAIKSEELARKTQAYLFHLSVSFLQGRFDPELQNMCCKHLQSLHSVLLEPPVLDPDIDALLSKHDSLHNSSALQQDLLEVMYKTTDSTQEKCGSQLLGFFAALECGAKQMPSHRTPPCRETKVSDNILDLLGLSQYYPQKLTRKDALCVHQQLPESKYLHILEKVMMKNYQYWKCLCEDEDDFIVHPVDALLAIMLCADNFLRQDLISKMATCQLAIPLLLPDPYAGTVTFPLWGMRSIVKGWKCKAAASESHVIECSIVEGEIPIVSFIRFSDSEPDSNKTKSKILNAIVGESKHNIFFNYDCEGGDTERKLMDGVVDLCWYLPAGKDNEQFLQAIAFANLRGNAQKHTMQCEFLFQISILTFVFLTKDDLSEERVKLLEHYSEASELVLLFLDLKESQKPKNLSNDYKSIGLKNKNLAEINKRICKQITAKLTSRHETTTLESCGKTAKKVGIHVDEDCPECCAGQQLAKRVMLQLRRDKDDADIKNKILPLQGKELWHEWAKFNKEMHRYLNKVDKTARMYDTEMKDKKDKIRNHQLLTSDPPTPVMEAFISALLQHNRSTRDYFLHWLKFLLDKCSRLTLPELQSRYEKLKRALQKPSDKSEEMKMELIKVNDEIAAATVGIEHFFRELGQMYEMVMDVPTDSKIRDSMSFLPALAAELLVEGYPLELMDGDASHVPMTWVMAVLDEVPKLLQEGKKRAKLFVVSVLGVQSSGKSTLLNTMFGIKFAVSAGRCTRGAFIQLLKLKRTSGSCEHLLVVDTEGLRAPELESMKMLKRDNEMATFVIGLANITIINIMGEAPSEMQDIMQTAVHAFIRMKKIDLKPSCLFVHQNVADVTAGTKLSEGRAKLTESLNEMVEYAAKEEQLEDKYKVFDQVVNFDAEKDVKYFNSLWTRSPPMSSVNPEYSEQSQELKSSLICLASESRQKFTFPTFKKHVSLLWRSVLMESYVFSFKNMLEVIAYSELDSKSCQWLHMFQSKVLELQIKMEKKVFSSNVEEFDNLEEELTKSINKMFESHQRELLEKGEKFFESCDHADIAIKWKEDTLISFKHICRKHQDQTHEYCRTLFQNRRDRKHLDNMRTTFYREIQGHVEKLALKLQEQTLDKEQLEREFEDLWKKQKKEILAMTQNRSRMNVELSIENCVKEIFRHKENDKINMKLVSRGLGETTERFVLESDHIIPPEFVWTKVRASYREYCVTSAERQTRFFLIAAKDRVDCICKHANTYSKMLGLKLLRETCDKVDKYNEAFQGFSFTEEYKIDLCLEVGRMAIKGFKKKIKETSPSAVLKQLKQPCYIDFENRYRNFKLEEGAARKLIFHLRVPIRTAVIESLASDLSTNIRLHDRRFRTKHILTFNMLLDLQKKQSFRDFVLYLENAEESMRAWIKVYTLDYSTTKDGEQTRLERLACEQLTRNIDLVISTASEVAKSHPKTLKDWLTNFHKRLADSFQLRLDELLEISGVEESKDKPILEFFMERFIQELQKLKKELKDSFTFLYAEMEEWKRRPYDILADEMIGCTKQCPFCGAVCEYMNPDHPGNHLVTSHRPTCLTANSVRLNLKHISLDVCTELVKSNLKFTNRDTKNKPHQYKKYREIYKDWEIAPNTSRYSSFYWKYFVAQYIDDITKHFGVSKPPPGSKEDKTLQEWKRLTWEAVEDNLKTSYQELVHSL